MCSFIFLVNWKYIIADQTNACSLNLYYATTAQVYDNM